MDEVSVELHTVIQSTLGGAIIGACFGGFVHSKNAYFYFLDNNQATIFKSTKQAQVSVGFINFGIAKLVLLAIIRAYPQALSKPFLRACAALHCCN